MSDFGNSSSGDSNTNDGPSRIRDYDDNDDDDDEESDPLGPGFYRGPDSYHSPPHLEESSADIDRRSAARPLPPPPAPTTPAPLSPATLEARKSAFFNAGGGNSGEAIDEGGQRGDNGDEPPSSIFGVVMDTGSCDQGSGDGGQDGASLRSNQVRCGTEQLTVGASCRAMEWLI